MHTQLISLRAWVRNGVGDHRWEGRSRVSVDGCRGAKKVEWVGRMFEKKELKDQVMNKVSSAKRGL